MMNSNSGHDARSRRSRTGFAVVALLALAVATLGSADARADAGPVRLARIVVVQGDVTWRPESAAPWAQATRNLPIRQGCWIAAPSNARCIVQFDDGSYLYLGRGAVLGLNTMYSDAQGEYTELSIHGGDMYCRLRQPHAVYQVDAPFCRFDARGPARFRVDATNGVDCAVRQGQVVVEGPEGHATLVTGDYLSLASERDAYDARTLPPHDAFDDWCAAQFAAEDRMLVGTHHRYVPANVAIACDDLDSYGTWHYDHRYGEVWCPRVRTAGWRPYHYGHWTWCEPFGWTWVSDEPWGWAPYHYGTWCHESYGWAWCPGPVHQYWCPAVVDYCQYGGNVAWCPLAPSEVRYPSALSVGFTAGNWSLFFSIGGAACYYPTSYGYCVPHPWRNTYINQVTYVNNVDYYAGVVNRNSYFPARGFVPVDARVAAGTSLAPTVAFGGRGLYRSLPADPRNVFASGRFVGAPAGGAPPIAGPPAIRPTAAAAAPTRGFRGLAPAMAAVASRGVYRAAAAGRDPVATARQTMARPPARAAFGRAAGRAGASRPGFDGTGFAGRAPGFARPGQAGQAGRVGGFSRAGQGAAAGRAASFGRAGQRAALGAAAAGGFAAARMAGRRASAGAGFSRPQQAAITARRALGMRTPGFSGSSAGRPDGRNFAAAGAAGARRGARSAAGARTFASGPRGARQSAAFARRNVGAGGRARAFSGGATRTAARTGGFLRASAGHRQYASAGSASRRNYYRGANRSSGRAPTSFTRRAGGRSFAHAWQPRAGGSSSGFARSASGYGGGRRSYGGYGGGARRSYGSRPSFGGSRPSFGGGRSYGGLSRRSYVSGGRAPFGGGGYGAFGGGRRSFGGGGARPSFGGGSPRAFGGGRSAFGGGGRSFGGDRPSFGGGEPRGFGGGRPSFGGSGRPAFAAGGPRGGGGGGRAFGGGPRAGGAPGPGGGGDRHGGGTGQGRGRDRRG